MKRCHVMVFIALLALVVTPGLAQPAPPGPPPPPDRPAPPGAPGPCLGNLHFIIRALDLSSEQADQIDQLLKARQEAAMAVREGADAARRALDEQIRATVFDETAIRSLAASAAVFDADRAVADAALLRDIRALLTEEQLAKFAELLAPPSPPSHPSEGTKR